jgi:hypothetical protein
MTPITSNKTAIASVILRDGKCAGFVLRTARGVQAYTRDEEWIALFPNEDLAVAAILEKAEPRP